MNEAEFVAKWESERDMYVAWGSFVANKICNDLEAVYPNIDLHKFIKIPPVPRAKETDSLLGKAFHRNKSYIDPYAEIEDKIGVRFVVLLTSDIKRIASIVEKIEIWHASLDKDFETDRSARPLEFTYQSVHYVVKATADISLENGLTVQKGTPCELQIRTLLQHAHSELTHDSIYKREPGIEVNRRVERTVAKSMALIETVDEYFVSAVEELSAATQLEREAMETLAKIFTEKIGLRPNKDKTNGMVLQAYRPKLGEELRANILRMLNEKPIIVEIIRDNYDLEYIYRQPWILLLFWLAQIEPSQTVGKWPLTPDELRPVYRSLSIRFPAIE
jgi:putative GTP pyrophosphokinase